MGRSRGRGDAVAGGCCVAIFLVLCSAFLVWPYDHTQPWPLAGVPARDGNASNESRGRDRVSRPTESAPNVTFHNSANTATPPAAAGFVGAPLQAKGAPTSAPRFDPRIGGASTAGERKQLRVSSDECDVFAGRWVYDRSYALYRPGRCPYTSPDFDCRSNGRRDFRYERWRWQPRDCDIPRFNASRLLEILRNKRLVYVGDSINRNQWESMVCLLRAAVPDGGGSVQTADGGKYMAYAIRACNCSVELSWAPFLVRQSRAAERETLRIDTVDEQAERWREADVLVFNTGHWWTHEEPSRGLDYFEENGRVHPRMEESVAFEIALRTWAGWVDANIDPRRTRVFFRGYSPVHFEGNAWGKKTGGGCFAETRPMASLEAEVERIYGERTRMVAVERVVGEMKTRVKLLNVTGLSMYRKDAHVSMYSSRYPTMVDKNDYSKADCSHWCLPGLPDVWNHLLYALFV